MQTVLKGEPLAHAQDVAYAAKAREEQYPRIAALALALAASEGIHARNFQKVLHDLGFSVPAERPPVTVGDTRANLHAASTAELESIDSLYPRFIKRITPEKCEEAIISLTRAWQAEKQHTVPKPELPKDACPICAGPVANYVHVDTGT